MEVCNASHAFELALRLNTLHLTFKYEKSSMYARRPLSKSSEQIVG